jgi:hypothetical protein
MKLHSRRSGLTKIADFVIFSLNEAVLGIRDILAQIRIQLLSSLNLRMQKSSVVDPDPGSGSVLDPNSIGPLDPDP